MTKIKLCGLRRPEDIQAANVLLPEYVGFVFAASRRQVTPEEAKDLKAELDPAIQAVGVFVNADIEFIADLCKEGTIDLVQLHGDEDASYMEELKKRTDCPIIRAVRVKAPEDITDAMTLPCDYLLLDAFHEKEYGGSGISFDWSLVPAISKPFFLAGGINERNVVEAIQTCHPYGVDVSSGIETDGVKDPEKMKEFVRRVRR